jgi:hypothetical protein
MGVLESKDKVDYQNRDLAERAGRRKEESMFASFNAEGGMPSWANILLRTVGLVGVPSVIALFLVYQNSLWGPRLQALAEDTRTDIAQVRKMQDQQAIKNDQIYRLLQRICSNTAKTADERQRCFDN